MYLKISRAILRVVDCSKYKFSYDMLKHGTPKQSYNIYLKMFLDNVKTRRSDVNTCSLTLGKHSGKEILIIKSLPKNFKDDLEEIWSTEAGGLLYMNHVNNSISKMANFKISFFGNQTIPIEYYEPREDDINNPIFSNFAFEHKDGNTKGLV